MLVLLKKNKDVKLKGKMQKKKLIKKKVEKNNNNNVMLIKYFYLLTSIYLRKYLFSHLNFKIKHLYTLRSFVHI